MSAQGNVRWWSRVLAVLVAGVALVATQVPAHAVTPGGEPAPVTGNTTYFDGLGSPYGGCGMPQANLETQNFIALNVYNTPGDYSFYPRPLTGANLSKIGMWNNGHNCGRWVRVNVGDYCTGVNDGAPGQAFCRNGSWVADAYNGATLDMIVADSCGDANAWCRDDPYHIDLAKDSLNRFARNGAPVGDLLPEQLQQPAHDVAVHPGAELLRRHQDRVHPGRAGVVAGDLGVAPAPTASTASSTSTDGAWAAAQMNSDMGQSFMVGGTTSGGDQFQIRVKDVTGAYIFGGREYSFSLPSSCGGKCSAARTVVTYTTAGGDTSTPTPTPTPSATVTPTATPTPTPTASPTPTPTGGSSVCTATFRAVNAWSGGYVGEVTVKAGASAITSWNVTLSGASVSSVWNGVSTGSGSAVTVRNVAYNGSLAAYGSTSFGFIGTGSPTTPSLACAS